MLVIVNIMNKLKHKLKLIWLRRKWVIQCVYNTHEYVLTDKLLKIEKKVDKLYHEAKRGGGSASVARAEGRQEVISMMKEALHGS
jgi:hypothetical protein